ncbi:MAG: dihydrodipicolinate synthase family protein, partial [Lachnospiraceae bacterium]|nr:dihydrodipicolinate synthase family protein [Lachnospiraceae bacterium]
LPEYAIAEYWNDISKAAPNTDFVIYNIPQLAGVALTQSLFAEMRKNPRVIGVKNSSMPVQDIQLFKQAAGEDYIVFNGPDEQFISGRVIGAQGGIGGTYGVMPELFLKMDELVKAGEMVKACEIQYDVNAVIYKMCSARGNMYGVIKEILRVNENLDLGGVRKPLASLVPEDMQIVEEAAKMIRDAKEKYL